MENQNFNSTNPYNFTFTYPEDTGYSIDKFINGPYQIYWYETLLLRRLVFRHLKNVKLIPMKEIDLRKRLSNINITDYTTWYGLHSYGVLHGITDSSLHYYYPHGGTTSVYHISPYFYSDSYVIYSSVGTNQRDDSEVLSIQGLGDSVWVLVALSLIAVSAVSSYIGIRKMTRGVADAKKMSAILRLVRVWWLLGVTAIIYHWSGSLKTNLIVDDHLFIDSLEDLASNPNLLCYIKDATRYTYLLKEYDSNYPNLKKQIRMLKKSNWQIDEKVTLHLVKGQAVVMDEGTLILYPKLFEKFKRYKKKLYVGKTKYRESLGYMFFNKRLPRDIKENIDYLVTRITETKQNEHFFRESNFFKRVNVFGSGNSDTLVSFTPINTVFLTIVFRVWIIGLSLAAFSFCLECFANEDFRERLRWNIVKLCRKKRQTRTVIT